ncbi:MAG: hypothetical protein KatS3mg108_3186 [Isosphaeraceae bacterium]|jgi:hypothetical protein|nr:MAG: hypothetical protein KatS3mg108_3186 [Isosphaeraceae bacterium]
MSAGSPNSLPQSRGNASSTALGNAAIITIALALGLWTLVHRRQLDWPPSRLFAAATTLTGYLALAGPLVLGRRTVHAAGLGDVVWLTVGLLFWLYNAASFLRGRFDLDQLHNPISPVGLGLAVAAVALASWRLHGPGRLWTWTNVTGWLLGLFWITAGAAALIPTTR